MNQKINIIHIDDDATTLKSSQLVFSQINELNYLQGFVDAELAIEFIKNNKVDLVFCDIEMPIKSGMWVANQLVNKLPIVFITAHSGYAIDAFDACALHYLLKPFTILQLQQVVERYNLKYIHKNYLEEQIEQLNNQYLPKNKSNPPNRIYINNIGKIIIINLTDLLYLTGAGNYTKFFLENGEIFTSSKNLKIYDESLIVHSDFVRISKSCIVNRNFVKQIVKVDNGNWAVEISNKEKFEISKGRLDEILEKLQ